MMQLQRWLTRLIGKKTRQYHKDNAASNMRNWNEEASVPLEWNVGDSLLNTYEVKGILGEGGMGKIYMVHHHGWNIDLAVKTPRPEIFHLDQSQTIFIQEAETWVNLGLHPNIVCCYYVRTLGGIPRVFVEYVEGGSLEDWIRAGRFHEGDRETSLARILDIAIQFAWGLHYAHEEGLIHQDVKPQNVMVTLDGEVKVTDFGLARARAMASEPGASGLSEGQSVLVTTGGMTPAYCSPEQAAGERLSRKTDIWSWAVSILEMFTGDVTWFSGQDAPQALEAYVNNLNKQSVVLPMPIKLVHLLRDCFQEDPANRPESMQMVVTRLQKIYLEEIRSEYPRSLTLAVELRADSMNNRALSLLDLGRLEDARQAWNTAQQIDPLHIQTTYNYGLWMWQTGQQPDDVEFIQQLKSAALANRGNWQAHYLLGKVYSMQGEMKSARKALEEAQQLSPEDDVVRTLLGNLPDSSPDRQIQTYEYPMPIQTVAFTPDMKYAILAGGAGLGENNTALVWDLVQGRLRYRLGEHKFMIEHVFVTPDGRRAITCDATTVRIWSMTTGKCLHTLIENNVRSLGINVAMTADGRYLALRVASKDYSQYYIRLLDVQTGQPVRKYVGRSQYLTNIEITPDGRHIHGAYEGGDICIWEMQSGKLIKTLHRDTEYIVSIVTTKDGKRILSGNEDGSLDIWEWQNDHCVHMANAHSGKVSQILITPDDTKALTRSEREVKLWDLATRRCIHTYTLHKEYITKIAITSDGKLGISASTDHTVRVLDLEKGRSLHTFLHKDRIHAIAVSPDGKYLLAAESQPHLVCTRPPYYKMYLWNLEGIGKMEITWEISRPTETQRLLQIEQVARRLLGEASLAVAAGRNTQALHALRRIVDLPGFARDAEWLNLWRQVGRTARREGLMYDRCVRTISHALSQGFLYLACTMDGKNAFVAGSGVNLRVWDLETGNCISTFDSEREGSITGIVLTEDEQYLVMVRGHLMLEVWDWRNNRIVCSLLVTGHQLRLGLSPDEKTIITSMLFKEQLNVWELQLIPGSEEIRPVRSLTPDIAKDEHWFSCLAISPNGQKVVAGSDTGKLLIWDIETGTHMVLLSDSSRISSVAFTPNGSRLLVGSEDNSFQVWKMALKPTQERFLIGHTDAVHALAVTPDSRYAFSGSADCTVRIWDISTGECIRVLQGHTSTVSAIKIVSEGWKVITASSDGSLRVWELDWEIE